MRYEVLAAKIPPPGTEVLSSHERPDEAAEAAKVAAVARAAIVEVFDQQLQRTIFRARGGEWRWITR